MLKKIWNPRCLIVLLFAISGAVRTYAQRQFADSAFEKYQAKNYAAAIKLYKLRINKSDRLFFHEILGYCYLGTDSIDKAKQEFKLAIAAKANNELERYSQFSSSNNLGELYYKEADFTNALHYYKYCDSIWKSARMDDSNSLEFHFYNSAKMGMCYDKLGKIDSAINIITPYIFCTYHDVTELEIPSKPYPPDSIKHYNVCKFYLSLLKKRYSNEQIKAELDSATNSFTYVSRSGLDKRTNLWADDLSCKINFLGCQVTTLHVEFQGDISRLAQPMNHIYTLDYQLKRYQQFLICRMIRDLP